MKFNKSTLTQFVLDEYFSTDDVELHAMNAMRPCEDTFQRYSRKRRAHYHRMTLRQKRRRQCRYPAHVLASPDESAAQRVLDSQDDQSYVTLTGFDVEGFNYMLEKYEPLFLSNSPFSKDGLIHSFDENMKKGGRKRALNAQQSLALYLAWTRTQGCTKSLQLIFGVNKTSLCIYLKFSRRILLHILSDDDKARIMFPSVEKITQMMDVVSQKYPAIPNTVFVMDGLKLNIEKSCVPHEQNAFYNGWQHSHWVVNVLVFDLSGKLVCAGLNAPGSWHDSTVADSYGVYSALQDVHSSCGARCGVDSAFRVSGRNADFLVQSGEIHKARDAQHALELSQATSLRQSAEWGVGSICKSFPRLKDKLKFERGGERKKIIQLMMLLHNLRVELVGQNQIRTVFFRDNLDRDVEEVAPAVV